MASAMKDEDYLSRVVSYRVDYDLLNLEALEKAEAYALSLTHGKESSTGGPAWNAYAVFEGTSDEDTKADALKFIRYVKRFKGYQLL